MDMSIEECRAECVAAFLAQDTRILSALGYINDSAITANDCKLLQKTITKALPQPRQESANKTHHSDL